MSRHRFVPALIPLVLVVACGTRGCATGEPTARSAESSPLRASDPALPGLGAGDAKLMVRLRAALGAKGPGYKPRTHHLNPDGSPKYINRLILETSPYLLQHAHNPVNWFPWGREAFDRARREGKPVLVSIGYSTCHWCHVMEVESFEDEEIARTINDNYIAIKVDREERPDVDDVYMKAVQMLTGSGGWPMTVVLTPDKDPFFGGTYFPARDGDRGARKGLLTILREIKAEYDSDRSNVVARAQQFSQRIEAASAPSPPASVPGVNVIEQVVREASSSFDPNWGGFGRAPKFPRPVLMELLLRYHHRTGDRHALEMVTVTLEHMAKGGIYDQVGGGFHRYSTDAHWLVPHFEKMLYDNAQLVSLYLEAYQASGRARFAQVARETLRYVEREMTAPEGACYSATDADSPTPSGRDEEGYFFTWTASELRRVLGERDARAVAAYFWVSEAGNFEERSILTTPREDGDVARELGMSVEDLRARVAAAREALYKARALRPQPHRDDKIVTSWNGLWISALARASLVLGDDEYARRAARAADFVIRRLRTGDGRLRRSFKDGHSNQDGFLDDYTFFIQGLLDLFEATSHPEWLEQAIALQGVLDRHFTDVSGGYFTTSETHERLLTRDKPIYDGAEPSGNSVAVLNLVRLSELTGKAEYRASAERALGAFSRDVTNSPGGSPKMLSALDFYLGRVLEIFVLRPDAKADAEPLLSRLRRSFVPNRAFALVTDGPDVPRLASLVPAIEGKHALRGRATAFVCERGHCELPTSNPDVFERQITAQSEGGGR